MLFLAPRFGSVPEPSCVFTRYVPRIPRHPGLGLACGIRGRAYSESAMSWWWVSAWVSSLVVMGALSFCLGAAYEHLSRVMRPEDAEPDRGAAPVSVVSEKHAV